MGEIVNDGHVEHLRLIVADWPCPSLEVDWLNNAADYIEKLNAAAALEWNEDTLLRTLEDAEAEVERLNEVVAAMDRELAGCHGEILALRLWEGRAGELQRKLDYWIDKYNAN